jgi:ABC-2 type transport system ATP-binding protein
MTMAVSPQDAPAIDSRDVTLSFPDGGGVFNLTYQVPAGSIFGMIGPSGCGKTTSVRLALGLYRPASGDMRVLGRRPTRFGTSERERIGYIPQQFVLYPTLSVAENASFVASLYGMSRRSVRRRLDQLLEFVDLAEARNRVGSQLSGGMQRRLMLICALMHDPVLLFADEPTAGIDPVLRERFWEYFRALRDQGHTMFVTTQYVGEAAYCDYVAVMRAGQILDIDTPENLRRKVLGGEVIEVRFAAEHEYDAIRALRQYAPVKHVRDAGVDSQGVVTLHVTVDDAASAMADVLNVLEDPGGPHITIQSAKEHQVSYDDVFIRIMEQEDETHAADN